MSNEGKAASKMKVLPLGSLQTSRRNRQTTIYLYNKLALKCHSTDCQPTICTRTAPTLRESLRRLLDREESCRYCAIQTETTEEKVRSEI